MGEKNKTKKQLAEELAAAHLKIAALEAHIEEIKKHPMFPSLTEQEGLLKTIFENLPLDIFARDKSQKLLLQSRTSVSSQPIGSLIEESTIDEEIRRDWLEINQSVLAGELVEIERAYQIEGKLRHFHVTVAPLYIDGKIEGVVGANIDITERKQLEERLTLGSQIIKKTNNQLKQRVHELSTLNLIAQTVSNATDLQSALEAIAEEIVPLFNAFSTGISLFNADRTTRTIVVLHQPSSPDEYKLVGKTFPIPRDEIYNKLIKQGQAVIVQKAQTNPLTLTNREIIKARNIQELLLVPLKAHGQIIGSINISTNDPLRNFSMQEVQLGETIAGHIAGTIALFQSLEQERRQRQIATSLLEVATTLNRSLDLHTVFSKIFEQLDQVIEHNGGGIFLSDKTNLVLIQGLGPAAAAHIGEKISLSSQNPTARAFNNKTMLVINDGATERYWLQWPEGDRLQSWIGVPLMVDQEAIGILTIDNFAANAYNQDDAKIMQLFGNQAALAIYNARLFEAVQQSEARYRIISEVLSNIAYVLRVDDKGTFTRVWATEETAQQLTGFTLAEIDARGGWLSIIREEDLPKALKHDDLLRNGQSSSVEYRIITKDGKERWILDVSRPIWDENKERVLFIYGGRRDISEHRRLEKHLLQTQKIEAIGQLTSGIAHHFNNMFTAMTGYLALSLEQLPPEHAILSDLERVQRITQRAAALVQQLLTFSKENVGRHTKQVNLNELLLHAKSLLEQLIDQTIQLEINLAPNLWLVSLDTNQFEQVLIHLVVNARDAMPQGGTLLFETDNIELTRNETEKSLDLQSGPYVKLTLRDNGVGMDAKTLSRIFEPFFTTKEVGQGIGLGLYTSLGIVKQHQGQLKIDSELNQGTTVSIFLPRHGEPAPQFRKDRNLELPQGTETILLVEDNGVVRDLTARILRQQGYTIIEADNGKTALELLDTQPDLIINLLLSDVILPKMRGDTLAMTLKERYPDLEILFISGYDESIIEPSSADRHNFNFLAKPFTPNTLIRKVHAILK